MLTQKMSSLSFTDDSGEILQKYDFSENHDADVGFSPAKWSVEKLDLNNLKLLHKYYNVMK